MHYIIAIDETGDFSPEKPVSVGGYVAKSDKDNFSYGMLNRTINDISSNADRLFQCPDDLHFSELFAGKKKSTGEYPGRDICHKYLISLIQGFVDKIHCVFTTCNSSRLYIHEQHNYFIHLETALYSLAQNLEIQANDKVDIYISSRRDERIMGIWGYENKEEYEKRIANFIKSRFSSLSGLREKNLRVEVLINARNTFLCMADIFVSSLASRDRDATDLRNIFKDKLINFDVGQHQWLSAPDIREQYARTPNEEKGEALFGLLCVASNLPKNSARNLACMDLFKNEFGRLDDLQMSSFAKFMEDRFSTELAKRGTFPRALDNAGKRISLIAPNLTSSREDIRRGIAQIKKEYLWEKVQLISHGHWHEELSAEIQDKTMLELKDFCNKHRDLLYASPLDLMRDKIEHALIFVQSGAFDRFSFDIVENFIRDDIESYRKTVKFAETALNIKEAKDVYLGKVAGSIGQAHGFLMCLPGKTREEKDFHFEIAKEQLTEDLKHFSRGSKDWLQGNNYLVTLFCLNGQIDDACRHHFWNMPANEKPKQGSLFRFDTEIRSLAQGESEKWDAFILCNHLRIGAMSLESCQDKKSYSSAIVELLENYQSGYPVNIAVKWGAYILDKIGMPEYGIRLMEKNGVVNAKHPVLGLMDIVNKAILLKLKSKISDEEADELRLQLKSIMEQGEGYKKFLEGKDWAKNVLDKKVLSCDIDDLVRGLPYYYG